MRADRPGASDTDRAPIRIQHQVGRRDRGARVVQLRNAGARDQFHRARSGIDCVHDHRPRLTYEDTTRVCRSSRRQVPAQRDVNIVGSPARPDRIPATRGNDLEVVGRHRGGGVSDVTGNTQVQVVAPTHIHSAQGNPVGLGQVCRTAGGVDHQLGHVQVQGLARAGADRGRSRNRQRRSCQIGGVIGINGNTDRAGQIQIHGRVRTQCIPIGSKAKCRAVNRQRGIDTEAASPVGDRGRAVMRGVTAKSNCARSSAQRSQVGRVQRQCVVRISTRTGTKFQVRAVFSRANQKRPNRRDQITPG